ncbi:hypothetical protein HJFPF1_04013 [Paramyrothecium foliicola]|nr:hypothetical protein HJFPF1_04013 [Paramyrothecium foliicola]
MNVFSEPTHSFFRSKIIHHFPTANMRFSTITLSALSMGSALALPAPADNAPVPSVSVSLNGEIVDGHLVQARSLEASESQAVEKRGATLVVLGIAGTAAVTKLTEMAIEIGADFIKNLGDWNDAREEFTKKTTDEMWKKNPNYAKFPAVACYNKGYHVQNPGNIDGKVSAKFKLGLLNTDYDCMYIAGPNQFYTHSDGGYINLSYTYNPNRCSFDKATGDLTCR